MRPPGFANNEPVQLELTGEAVTVLRVDDITPLPGPGLIAGEPTLETKRDAVAAFVAATLRAMEEIAADPELGLEAAIVAVPELGDGARDAGRHPGRDHRVVDRAGPGGRGPRRARSRRLGGSIEYLTSLGLVPNPVTSTTSSHRPAAGR